MAEISEDQEVKFVRLKNGDDVIAQVVEFSENDEAVVFALINPLKIVYIPSSKRVSYLQVAFMPWVFNSICEDQEFMVHAEDVLTMNDVTGKMEEYYWTNLDHFVAKEEPVDEFEEVESTEEANLEDLLDALKSGKRTYH